jgi:hypothetical protein
MPKFIQGDVIDLTPEQIAAIDWFIANPPKAYVAFYKIYKKVLGPAIFLLIVAAIIMAIIHTASHLDLFNAIKYVFFVAFGFGMISLVFYLYKHFYTKRYAKQKLGWNMKMWNRCTMGLSWDI